MFFNLLKTMWQHLLLVTKNNIKYRMGDELNNEYLYDENPCCLTNIRYR